MRIQTESVLVAVAAVGHRYLLRIEVHGTPAERVAHYVVDVGIGVERARFRNLQPVRDACRALTVDVPAAFRRTVRKREPVSVAGCRVRFRLPLGVFPVHGGSVVCPVAVNLIHDRIIQKLKRDSCQVFSLADESLKYNFTIYFKNINSLE